MVVLETDVLIFVSYSNESTTFHKVHFDEVLWERILGEATALNDKHGIVKHTRSRPQLKSLKELLSSFVKTNVEFLCEVPSLHMIDSMLSVRLTPSSPFNKACPVDRAERECSQDDIISTASHTKTVLETGYHLSRRKATEVMVWVLTNKDRNSSLEIPCSLPIAYGLKDYRLSAKEMRDATDYVLEKCHEKGIHVVGFYTDGQWISLMHRDNNDNLLTLVQLQKDAWVSTKGLGKVDLIRKFSGINYKRDPNDPLEYICWLRRLMDLSQFTVKMKILKRSEQIWTKSRGVQYLKLLQISLH